MIYGGQWYLGPGDASPEIRKIKDYMRRMYRSYAGHLADTELYDQEMFDVVLIMQQRLFDQGKLPADKVNGLIGASTKVAMGYLKATDIDIRPIFLTACGTGVPWWVGPDADTARAVENLYKWRPIGYRAAAVPMGPSIAECRNEGVRIVNEERAQIERNGLVLGGFSQGAIGISELWEYDIKPVNGRLHWALPHVKKAVCWGNPMREVGKAWPDPGGPIARADSGGITPKLMVDTPDWWRNYAHAGDLYTEVVDDESAENKRAIWAIIRGQQVFSGPDSILAQIFELLGVRRDASLIAEAYGAFKAMWDAGMFFAKRTGPHLNYSIAPAIEYLRGGR